MLVKGATYVLILRIAWYHQKLHIQPSSGDETGLFRDTQINTTVANALAPYIARTSTNTVITVWYMYLLVFHEGGFLLPVTPQSWETKENAKNFLRELQHTKGKICRPQSPVAIQRHGFLGMRIPMIKIKLSCYRLFCIMGILIMIRRSFICWDLQIVTPSNRTFRPGGCGLSVWCPIFKSTHCNSFQDRTPVDFIHWCPIFK